MRTAIISIFLLAAALRQTANPTDPALERLAKVDRFAFGGVGYAGSRSQGEKDFRVILSQPSPLADFEHLLAAGNIQAQAYALTGIRMLNMDRFRELAQLRRSQNLVTVQNGCILSHEPLSDLITDIEAGHYVIGTGDWGGDATRIEIGYPSNPCADLMMDESRLWTPIEGAVSKIIDGRMLLLTLAQGQTLRVHFAGIAFERRGAVSQEAKRQLEQMLLNRPVKVLVNQRKWIVLDKRPEELAGVVGLREGGPDDVALALLTQGLVRFHRSPTNTMPEYTACLYRKAEADAQSKKLGLWRL